MNVARRVKLTEATRRAFQMVTYGEYYSQSKKLIVL